MYVVDSDLSRFSDDLQIAFHGTEVTVPQFSEFMPLSESDVKVLISRSSLKTCHLDPVPSKSVTQCDVLLPLTTCKYYQPFPSVWLLSASVERSTCSSTWAFGIQIWF